MNEIVNNILKEKLYELEQVKLNLDLKINELSIGRDELSIRSCEDIEKLLEDLLKI
ncbi:hypothetical protein [Terrisporobacter sp.]